VFATKDVAAVVLLLKLDFNG